MGPQKKPFELSESSCFAVGTGLFVLTCVVPFYITLVIQSLWNWFVAEALHVGSISYWQALGLVMLVYLLTYPCTHSIDEEKLEKRWEQTLAILELCVPDENLPLAEAVKETHKPERGLLGLFEIFKRPVGAAIQGTIFWGIGWAVHSFLM